MDFTALQKRLRKLRTRHKLRQEDVAERASIDAKYYQDIELGRRDNPSFKVLNGLAKVYGISVHRLLAPEMPRTKLKATSKKSKK